MRSEHGKPNSGLAAIVLAASLLAGITFVGAAAFNIHKISLGLEEKTADEYKLKVSLIAPRQPEENDAGFVLRRHAVMLDWHCQSMVLRGIGASVFLVWGIISLAVAGLAACRVFAAKRQLWMTDNQQPID